MSERAPVPVSGGASVAPLPPYSTYRPSGVEWLGEVPSHWKCLKLKRLSLVKRGASPRPIDDQIYFDEAGEYSWVRISDVTASNRYLEQTEQRLSPLGKSLSVPLEPGTLFLSIAGSVGKPIITKIKCCIHDGFVYFPEFQQNSEFLYYIFRCPNVFAGLGKLGTQLNLNSDTVADISIPLPSPEEQSAIVAYLDRETGEIDALTAKKERLIALLEEKRAALISHAVTRGLDPNAPTRPSGIEWLGEVPGHWQILPIKRIAYLKSGEAVTFEDIRETGEYPVYGGNGLRGYTNHFTHNGEFPIIGRQGALCGNVRLVDGKFFASEHAVVVIPVKTVVARWLAEILRAMNLNQYSVSAAQPGLSVEKISNLLMPLPPYDEQTAIADYLDRETGRIDTLITKIRDHIKLLKERRGALIAAAVTGRFDARGAV